MFHLFYAHSVKVQKLLARLDYGGISFLISGSTFSPVMYSFACNPFPKWLYISVVTTFCLLAFVMTLIPGAETPEHRRLRGLLFIIVGMSAGLPALHAALTR